MQHHMPSWCHHVAHLSIWRILKLLLMNDLERVKSVSSQTLRKGIA